MNWRYWIAPAILVLLLVLLGIGLTLSPGTLPSPLIGKPRPALGLPALDGDPQRLLDPRPARPHLINFWASWCVPCLHEHPLLMQLAREQGVQIIGVNYKDAPVDARRWLARHGDPFAVVLQDRDGARAIDWGVYGVPETFVIGADGTVLYKHVGPLDRQVLREQIVPLLAGGTR